MEHAQAVIPPLWAVTPFIILLTCIALGPLFWPDGWSKHYTKVSILLGGITVLYYGLGYGAWGRSWETGQEYLSFIALIGSLFVVSGGIHIGVKGEATPTANVVFLFLGALVANLLGTTGASMLLIRPWIRMNKYRITSYHVVFFIFIISNVGGCLTPIGDPPLFLGYLQGVPFWWITRAALPVWATAVGLLLAIFYVFDWQNYHRAPKAVRARLAEGADQWKLAGLTNLFFLAVILAAVFIDEPKYLREALMVGAAVASYLTTADPVHQANDFNFHPIREVAILFAGIFATMMPALDWLRHHAGLLGNPTPGLFFWASGSLSSVLDNAPTYLSFLNVLIGGSVDAEVVGQVQTLLQSGGQALAKNVTGPMNQTLQATLSVLKSSPLDPATASKLPVQTIQIAYLIGLPETGRLLLAISAGSVFFGANTYIGNGPNFMVKAIAEQQRVRTPTFVGYVMMFTLPVMLPMLLVVWWCFFRG